MQTNAHECVRSGLEIISCSELQQARGQFRADPTDSSEFDANEPTKGHMVWRSLPPKLRVSSTAAKAPSIGAWGPFFLGDFLHA